MITRWICEKDNKKWIYPIEKCIYCKGPVKKQTSTKAIVIGITKVNISSPLHPITPYNVILLEDEHGNRMPKKTMKDYKIGDKHFIDKAKTDSAVIITKIKYDLGDALNASLELLNSFDFSKGDKILVKPCIIEPAYPYQAVNTNPLLLDEIIKMLRGRSFSDILVAEQAMPGNDVMGAANKSGILDVCEKHKVKFADLGKAEYVEKEEDDFKFNIAKEIMERRIINVPVMKTNSQIGISGAMENMLRVVDLETQKRMFAEDIEKTLPKLIKALPNFLTIGDATLGMHGQGPTALGEPAFLNMLFASKDAVALDSVFSEAGIIQKPRYVKEASSIGAGNGEIPDLEIVGDEIEAIKCSLKAADNGSSAHPRIMLIDGKADPYIFNTALKISSKLFGLGGYELHIAIGKFFTEGMIDGKNRIVAYGNDAINRMRELNAKALAEIPENMDDMEKLVLLKSLLENPNKKGIDMKDRIKSKIAKFGAKIKGAL